MSEMKLMFKTPDDICEFVNTVSRFDYDVDIKCGRVTVDAKSLLGLMQFGQRAARGAGEVRGVGFCSVEFLKCNLKYYPVWPGCAGYFNCQNDERVL